MNKQNVQKLALFLAGLEQRLTEKADFFIKLTAIYKSGGKSYPAAISMVKGGLKMIFTGTTKTIPITELAGELSGLAESYDGVVVTYEERGSTLFIEAEKGNVRMYTRENDLEKGAVAQQTSPLLGGREYYIKVGQADRLLKEIGILTQDGKVKNDMIRKYNQIDHFVELIDEMLRNLAERVDTVNVLDCGCGKSYLSFVLNYYIKEVLKKTCYFIGIDVAPNVVEAARRTAQSLGYHNMEFQATNIRNYDPEREIHLVISLHACDTATDEAIAFAVNQGVKAMVMVPCCQKELLNQYRYPPFEPVIKHGVLKARMADVLTDGLRALLLESYGYKVSIVEYVSPLDTPKNLMLRAEQEQGVDRRAREEFRRLTEAIGVDLTLERLIYRS